MSHSEDDRPYTLLFSEKSNAWIFSAIGYAPLKMDRKIIDFYLEEWEVDDDENVILYKPMYHITEAEKAMQISQTSDPEVFVVMNSKDSAKALVLLDLKSPPKMEIYCNSSITNFEDPMDFQNLLETLKKLVKYKKTVSINKKEPSFAKMITDYRIIDS